MVLRREASEMLCYIRSIFRDSQRAVVATLGATTVTSERTVLARAACAVIAVVLSMRTVGLMQAQYVVLRASKDVELFIILKGDGAARVRKRRSDRLVAVHVAGRIGVGDADIQP